MPSYIIGTSNFAISDIAIRVKRIFGDESGTELTDDDILRWVNDAQLDISRKTRCIVRTEVYDTVNGQHQFVPPSEFLFFLRAIYDGRLLSVSSYQDIDSRYPNRAVEYPKGTPEYITFIGNSMQLYPAPDKDGTDNLIVTYVARPLRAITLTDVLEIPEQYYEAVVRFCLMRAKELDQDWTASQILQKSYEDELSVVRDDVAQPLHNTYPVVRDYDGDY